MPQHFKPQSTLRIPSLRGSADKEAPEGNAQDLQRFLDEYDKILVLTGAGLSTNSGIPAYRDKEGQWLRRTPIFYQDFIRCPIARRRYWARSYFGWHHVANAQPNAGHFRLAELEGKGRIDTLITQNVDGLHERAGTQSLIEIHGQLGRVKCLDCESRYSRHEIQERLESINQQWSADVLGFNPDGDVELDETAYPDFNVVACPHCQGRLKPDVVFFGESVPSSVSHSVEDAIHECDGVLVVGSSLVVMSGYRIAKLTHQLGKPVVAINEGRTRADDLLAFKIPGDCVDILNRL